jgi:Fe-S oxidoreductase
LYALSDYSYTMESCNSCGQCRFILGPMMKGWEFSEICPIYSRYRYEAHSGQGLINIAQELLEGELDYEQGLIEHIYQCTTCGACDINCKSVRDMEVLDTILALRARCVENGWGPMPEHKETAKLIETDHNIFGRPHEQRFNWLPKKVQLSEDTGIAFFSGCAAAYSFPEIARDTTTILDAGGIEFKVMDPEECCCGAPLWRTGQIDAATNLAKHNLEAFKRNGIKTVITSCAECYGTFMGFYPRLGTLDIEVLHISQVVQRMVLEKRLTLNNKMDMRVTYHDPCLLGRLSEPYVPWNGIIKSFGYHDPPKQWRRGTHGVYEAPREVLKTVPGIELIEMTRHAENAFCCGGGGGVPQAFPDFALWTARERLGEAKSTGAEAVVSCCPWCKENFSNAMDLDAFGMRYYDLTDLVVRAL